MPPTGMNTVNSTAQLIAVLVIFVLVLALTLFVTRWIARYQKGQWAGGNIEVLETCPMGNGKFIQIVRLGNTYVAIAVCKDTVTLLAELSEEQIKMPSEDGKKSLNFKELFQKAKDEYPGNGQTNPKEE